MKETHPVPPVAGVLLPLRGDMLHVQRLALDVLTPAARRAAVFLAQRWPVIAGPPNLPGVGGGVVRRPDGLLDVALPLQDLTPPDAAGAAVRAAPARPAPDARRRGAPPASGRRSRSGGRPEGLPGSGG